MYNAYFVNTKTGELWFSSAPEHDKEGTDWKQVSKNEYDLFYIVRERGKSDQLKSIRFSDGWR